MFESLRTKLASSPVQALLAAGRKALRADNVDGMVLLEELAGETHFRALQTAVLVSGVNALAMVGRLKDPLLLNTMVPTEPDTPVQLSRRRRDIDLEFETFLRIRDFVAEIAPVQREADRFCSDVRKVGAEHAAFLHLARLNAACHRLAQYALVAVNALDPAIKRCLPRQYDQNTTVLRTLLTSALSGGQPCMDEHGHLHVPDLPQRRPASRRGVHVDCTIEHLGQTAPAVIKDVSSGGLGLEETPALTPQKVIVVEVGERCFAGLVVWSKGSRAGMKFDTPLRRDDPLLRAP